MLGAVPESGIEGIGLGKSPALRSVDGFREMHGKGPDQIRHLRLLSYSSRIRQLSLPEKAVTSRAKCLAVSPLMLSVVSAPLQHLVDSWAW